MWSLCQRRGAPVSLLIKGRSRSLGYMLSSAYSVPQACSANHSSYCSLPSRRILATYYSLLAQYRRWSALCMRSAAEQKKHGSWGCLCSTVSVSIQEAGCTASGHFYSKKEGMQVTCYDDRWVSCIFRADWAISCFATLKNHSPSTTSVRQPNRLVWKCKHWDVKQALTSPIVTGLTQLVQKWSN